MTYTFIIDGFRVGHIQADVLPVGIMRDSANEYARTQGITWGRVSMRPVALKKLFSK